MLLFAITFPGDPHSRGDLVSVTGPALRAPRCEIIKEIHNPHYYSYGHSLRWFSGSEWAAAALWVPLDHLFRTELYYDGDNVWN